MTPVDTTAIWARIRMSAADRDEMRAPVADGGFAPLPDRLDGFERANATATAAPYDPAPVWAKLRKTTA